MPAPHNRSEAAIATHPGMTCLPVAFLMADADSAAFSEEENTLITAAQEQFAAAMAKAPTQNTTSPEYYGAWLRARQLCDDWLRLRLGQDAFNRFTSIAAQTSERRQHGGTP